jgi:predicted dehydrogenase
VTAGSKSDAVISTAFRLTRKKGRVVIVGDVGLSLKRSDFYAKEIDVLISCSYGPGRYDHTYEEAGLDYPLPFVRWTEGRNLECFLDLLARKQISIDALGPATFPLEDAAAAYASLAAKESAPLAVFLSYGTGDVAPRDAAPPSGQVQVTSTGRLRVGVIGAGGFATAVHLPNLKKLRTEVEITAVAGRTGHRVAQAAKEYGAKLATTDIDAVLSSSDVDAVLIASRHDSHAALARRALERGRHVFVEKPTATTRSAFEEIDKLVLGLDQQGRLPVLMTGYNRRFSKLAVRARDLVRRRACPLVISYRMAAGYLGPDHWTKGPEGGGRNIGEACHIYDLFRFLVGSPVKTVKATPLGGPQGAYQLTDNFATSVVFEDGSVATLIYTAQGPPTIEKERLELFSEKTAIVIDNWTAMTIYGSTVERIQLKSQDKGFEEELRAFVAAAKGARQWPISWEEQRDVAEVAFLAQGQLEGGTSCAV